MRQRRLHRLTCSLAVLALTALGSAAQAHASTAGPSTATSNRVSAVQGDRAADRADPRGHTRRGYAALGDSYSSGEGTGVYDPATDTAVNRCHRSPLAYPPLLSESDPRLRPLRFVACSGARTADLYAPNHAYPTEPAQLSALTRRTRAVSLTLGGNDVGFATVLGACIEVGISEGGFGCSQRPDLNAAVQGWTATLAGQAQVPGPGGLAITPIRQVLTDIAAAAPQARIYLAGYPELWGDQVRDYTASSAPSGASCLVSPAAGARVDYADAQWFNANTRRLNDVLRTAAASARASGLPVRYVPPTRFEGHGLCDAKTAWIQPLLLSQVGTPRPESFHPTATGQRQGYRPAFRRAGL